MGKKDKAKILNFLSFIERKNLMESGERFDDREKLKSELVTITGLTEEEAEAIVSTMTNEEVRELAFHIQKSNRQNLG